MNRRRTYNCFSALMQAVAICLLLLIWSLPTTAQNWSANNFLGGFRFHLTNHIQQGNDIGEFPKIMGSKVRRVALFSIPLQQQQWSYRLDGDHAPTYYVNSITSHYHYSFSEASFAMAYIPLQKDAQAHFDPMITQSHPADVCVAGPITRVLPALFLFEADNVALVNQGKYLRGYERYEYLGALLRKRAEEKMRIEN